VAQHADTPTGETPSALSRRVETLVRKLIEAYPNAECALHHENPLQLLVATILSAQCTDARVNKVTPALFARFPSARDYARADRGELEEMVRTTGFFRNKAKSIQGATARIEEAFHGEVPRTMAELLSLPGVARKTANVVLGTAFGVADGFVVDTHVYRLSHRMGLAKANSPEQVEKQLTALVPREHWIRLAHILIHHGRAVCSARTPDCDTCVVADECPKLGITPKATSKTSSKAKAGTRTSSTGGASLKQRIASSLEKRSRKK
jgi:endonuclease-3